MCTLAVLMCAMIVSFSHADNSTDAATTASTAPSGDLIGPYLLAADDVLTITVVNFPNLSQQIVVPPDGKISVPLLKSIDVTGKTTSEVRAILAEGWKKYVINPSVTVSLAQKRKDNILVYGYVVKPGTGDFRPGMRILEAIAQMGGPLPLQADMSKVTVTHRNGAKQTLDLSNPETKGGTPADIPLQIGDVIYIPESRAQVSVVGEVANPGSFDYRADMNVLQALTAAGGVKESADLANASLQHNGEESKLDLDALLRHGDFSINKKLAAGDKITVPEIKNRVYVFGAISHPGYYIFKPDDRVLDALNGCGGPVRDAAMNKINLIRIDRAKSVAKVTEVNIEKFLKKGDIAENVSLKPGDVLYIPDKKHSFQAQDLLGLLSGINLVGSTFRILSGKYY
jgi:polysaccharide export outer membrane protein